MAGIDRRCAMAAYISRIAHAPDIDRRCAMAAYIYRITHAPGIDRRHMVVHMVVTSRPPPPPAARVITRRASREGWGEISSPDLLPTRAIYQ